MPAVREEKIIFWFNEVDKEDIPLVGGKGANLGEMTSFGIPVPRGFIISSRAYFNFLEENQAKGKILKELNNLVVDDPVSLSRSAERIKNIIRAGKISESLRKQIIDNYLKMGGLFTLAEVAVRSSATAEDLPTASFAGQQKTFLNIRGEKALIESVKECWQSLFEPRAIFYRQEKGFDHFKVGLAVIVQEMVPAEISGVMFTVDPVTNKSNRIIIEAIYGLGEYIVQGEVTPDRYVVDSRNLEIIHREIAKQTIQLTQSGRRTKTIAVDVKKQTKRKLNDKQIIELAKIGKKIHHHYFFPQDIEWTFYKNRFYIVQARPVTTLATVAEEKKETFRRKLIIKGLPASPGIASGPVLKIESPKQISKVKRGDVLVVEMTTPDYVPAMKKAAAIITDKGGQTSHAAIVSRELGVPCVVGTEKATKILKNGQIITVNGQAGEVYAGGLIGTKSIASPALPVSLEKREEMKTRTKIYVNMAEPQLAESIALRPVDGVGLLRAEFMIAEIGIHPKKLIKERKQKIFINGMAEGLSKICRHFYPRPVVYRATDFKTNEYRYLNGGRAFEQEEENPLIGYRGAFRYIHDPRVFEMELDAIKAVRQNFNNLWLMIPFVHTPKELEDVKRIIIDRGLSRSASFKLWMMVEIPANVILLENFIKVGIDGVSIGTNDLTMLTLGVDRDNAALTSVYNENDPAVIWEIEKTIRLCRQYRISSSICGQAASTSDDLIEKLVALGITSLSVNPDAIERVRRLVYEIEARLTKNKS